jgi:hypothetical protein
MNRLLIVFVLIVAAIVGLGFYLGWFRVESDKNTDKVHINFTVDRDKIEADKQKALEKMHGLGHQSTDKTTVPTGKGQD